MEKKASWPIFVGGMLVGILLCVVAIGTYFFYFTTMISNGGWISQTGFVRSVAEQVRQDVETNAPVTLFGEVASLESGQLNIHTNAGAGGKQTESIRYDANTAFVRLNNDEKLTETEISPRELLPGDRVTIHFEQGDQNAETRIATKIVKF